MSDLEPTLGVSHSTGGLLYVGQTASRSTSPYASRVDLTLNPYTHPDGGALRPQSPSRSIRTYSNDPPGSEVDVMVPHGGDGLYAIAPADVGILKYHRFEYYSMDDSDARVPFIERHQFDYERENIPLGWKAYVCPEGKLYFAHKEKRVVTLTNILEDDNHARIMDALKILEPEFPSNSSDIELLVQCTWADGVPVIGYYFAHWEKHIVFWYKQVVHTLVTKGERPPVSKPHLQLAVHSQFGLHVEMFCAHRTLPVSMVKEVKGSYESGTVDTITSDQSIFSYDADTTDRIIRILERVPKKATVNRHTSWIVGRFYKTLYSDRYLAFYGESGARCSRGDNTFKGTGRSPRTMFFFLISPILFFMPLVYLKELDAAFVDKIVYHHVWRRFIAVLKRDWENAITPATVLLSANVGFLAIQSIDNTGVSGNRSAAQIASYISAILSLFIYISCQILTRRHRHHETEQADRALKFLARRQQRLLGLQAVAMAFSLPIALFMWSMISFLAAMVFVFFDKTNLATKVTLSIVLGVLFVITAALLYMEWDNAAPMSGFGIFWAELKTYGTLLSDRFKHSARPNSDADSPAMNAGSEMFADLEVEHTKDNGSNPPASGDGRKKALSRFLQSLKQSILPLSSLVERRWPFRRIIFKREDRALRPGGPDGNAAELATLPIHSAPTPT